MTIQKTHLSKVLSASLLFLAMTGAHAMLPTPAEAQPIEAVNTANSGINSQTVVYVVTKSNSGAEQLTPVTANNQLKQGDVIEYHTQLTNNHHEEVRSMKVAVAVPAQVELLGNITPILDEASLDGTNFYPTPIRGRINGQAQEVPVSYYKSLRWKVTDLGVNESTSLVYRAVVR